MSLRESRFGQASAAWATYRQKWEMAFQIRRTLDEEGGGRLTHFLRVA